MKNLYELLDGAQAAELEPVLDEKITGLPADVSLSNIKSKAIQDAGIRKKRPFRWQHLAGMAACLCLVVAAVWAAGLYPKDKAVGQEAEDAQFPSTESYRDMAEEAPTDAPHGMGSAGNASPEPGEDLGYEAAPPVSIRLNGLEELEEMRDMAQLRDGEVLDGYLASMMGASSREDLLRCLDAIDRCPVLRILRGAITGITYYPDSESVQIVTEAENGDWVRLEYEFRSEMPSSVENDLLDTPVYSSDSRIAVHAEQRRPHPSGSGDMITWIMEADGIYVRVTYRVSDGAQISVENVLEKTVIYYLNDDWRAW